MRYATVRFDEDRYTSYYMDIIHMIQYTDVFESIDGVDVGFYSLYDRSLLDIDSDIISEVYRSVDLSFRRVVINMLYMLKKIEVDLSMERREVGTLESYEEREEYMDLEEEFDELTYQNMPKIRLTLEDRQFSEVCKLVSRQEKFNLEKHEDAVEAYDNFNEVLNEFEDDGECEEDYSGSAEESSRRRSSRMSQPSVQIIVRQEGGRVVAVRGAGPGPVRKLDSLNLSQKPLTQSDIFDQFDDQSDK